MGEGGQIFSNQMDTVPFKSLWPVHIRPGAPAFACRLRPGEPVWKQDRGVISSISPCEGDGSGANPGFLTNKNENAQRALKEIGLSASGFCSESNPSPGSRISTPVFGCELFVAQLKDLTIHSGGNRKLFTAFHQLFTIFETLNRLAANSAVRRNRPASGWFNRGSNPHSAHNRSIGWKREKSRHGPRK